MPKTKTKVMAVVGTRPEAIKMAPVIKELCGRTGEFESTVCVTGQHREMLDQALQPFEIVPDFDLKVMVPNQKLAGVTTSIIQAFDDLLDRVRPDWILVQGDTTTVMASSLVAFYHRVKVGHVEAGLRSGEKYEPYPEEINRRICDLLADLHFAPTERNRDNLLREGVSPNSIIVSGNTVIDALQITVERLRQGKPRIDLPQESTGKRLILVTAHRRESFGRPLEDICRALRRIATHFQDSVHIVYPVHRNPNVRNVVFEELKESSNITLLDPVDYETLVQLMVSSHIVITDSGGIQEEAPSLGKPVLVLRDVTERQEIVELGGAKLVGTDPSTVFSTAAELLENASLYRSMASVTNPYGDGRASGRIVDALLGQPSASLSAVPLAERPATTPGGNSRV